jgi:GT2 family glycosyltransferase
MCKSKKTKLFLLYSFMKQENLLNLSGFNQIFHLYRRVGMSEFSRRLKRLLSSLPVENKNKDDSVEKILNLRLKVLKEREKKQHRVVLEKTVVDIIIPVYNGLPQLKKCLSSVQNSCFQVKARVIIINDASPDEEVKKFLKTLTYSEDFILLENEHNLGFTATVNRGMQLSNNHDVVLLNSDTEVANNWLDKLICHAHSSENVGTITPFSNNATICSYPTIEGMVELPIGETTQSLDTAFYEANLNEHIELPTAVGFCMYIRRDCLNDVGFFDVATYGKGYGEENDFCIRANRKGWKHLLAADTFVYHEGEASFKTESAARKKAAMKILRQLYPEYEPNVMRHIALNEAYLYRLSAAIALFKLSKKPVILHMLHSWGGGTEKHVVDLCKQHLGKAKSLIMNSDSSEIVKIKILTDTEIFSIYFNTIKRGQVIEFLNLFNISLVHVHHTLEYKLNPRYFIDALKVPFYFTIHDYYAICPRITLMRPTGGYCGEPDTESCNRCLSMTKEHHGVNILQWRQENAWLFEKAIKVICPSQDVYIRCKRYHPNAAYEIVYHEKKISKEAYFPKINRIYGNDPLIVLIIGAIGRHKGVETLKSLVAMVERYEFPFKFYLIGFSGEAITENKNIFMATGQYKEEDLLNKIREIDPHLILFTSLSPETYNYTLTAALNAGYPIMASDIGAHSERLSSLPWVWRYDPNRPVIDLAEQLCYIRENNFKKQNSPAVFEHPFFEGAVKDGHIFYQSEYFNILTKIVDEEDQTVGYIKK